MKPARSDRRRVLWLERIAVLGLIASFLAAPGLWLEHPFFAPLPIAGDLRPLPPFDPPPDRWTGRATGITAYCDTL